MRRCPPPPARCAVKRRLSVRRWLSNDDGAAALEFAIVALPFFMLVLGILGMGLYFLANSQLEYGVEVAARRVRTGEAQKDSTTVGRFKQDVCTAAGSYIDCDKLSVIVQHASSWSGISPQACVDSKGNMVGSTGSTGDLVSKYTGEESEVVLVTVCYQWDLASSFSFLRLGNASDGTGPSIIQAATAFRSEPYQ